MTILGEYTDLKALFVGQTMAVPATLPQQRPDVVESYLKGEIEALAFSLAPKNKPVVLKTLARWLKVDQQAAKTPIWTSSAASTANRLRPSKGCAMSNGFSSREIPKSAKSKPKTSLTTALCVSSMRAASSKRCTRPMERSYSGYF